MDSGGCPFKEQRKSHVQIASSQTIAISWRSAQTETLRTKSSSFLNSTTVSWKQHWENAGPVRLQGSQL